MRTSPWFAAGLCRRLTGGTGACEQTTSKHDGGTIALFRELHAAAGEQVLLCTDLHAENILAARREPWLVIDPKPYVGDSAYDVLQYMVNCEDRLAADPAGLADRMAGLAGLDPARVRLWLFARSVQESPGSPLMRQVARRLAPP
jgi:streptomycin 6-kinase